MSVVVGHDCIHVNIGHLPPGQAAGYTTGSADIRWTGHDWVTHPGAVRICQDAAASDHSADVLDVERFAATNSEAAAWYSAALKAYNTAQRPGQRAPAIYTSASNVTPLVNALIAGKVTKGPKLWVADWNGATDADRQAIKDASGPYPIIGFQFASGQFYDSDLFSSSWLGKVSEAGPQWQEWHSDGSTTLAQLAAACHLWVSHILSATGQHQNGRYDPVFATYTSAGIWSAPIPVGATLWVRQ